MPLRGQLVTPLSTVYLDAIQGGRVEEMLVEDGATVEAGQLLARAVEHRPAARMLAREAVDDRAAQRTAQPSSCSSSRTGSRTSATRRDRLPGQAPRARQSPASATLVTRGLVAQVDARRVQDELDYYMNRQAVTLESQADRRAPAGTAARPAARGGSTAGAEPRIARKNLDELDIRAPVAGQLSGFAIEVGQSLARRRAARPDRRPERNKLGADIDEFYLGRVDSGRRRAEHGGQDYDARGPQDLPAGQQRPVPKST